jgi:hypothetical protein
MQEFITICGQKHSSRESIRDLGGSPHCGLASGKDNEADRWQIELQDTGAGYRNVPAGVYRPSVCGRRGPKLIPAGRGIPI